MCGFALRTVQLFGVLYFAAFHVAYADHVPVPAPISAISVPVPIPVTVPIPAPSIQCDGSDYNCCSTSDPCLEGGGDCDKNDQCYGDLICGTNNCGDFHANANADVDCCVRAIPAPMPVLGPAAAPGQRPTEAPTDISNCPTSSYGLTAFWKMEYTACADTTVIYSYYGIFEYDGCKEESNDCILYNSGERSPSGYFFVTLDEICTFSRDGFELSFSEMRFFSDLDGVYYESSYGQGFNRKFPQQGCFEIFRYRKWNECNSYDSGSITRACDDYAIMIAVVDLNFVEPLIPVVPVPASVPTSNLVPLPAHVPVPTQNRERAPVPVPVPDIILSPLPAPVPVPITTPHLAPVSTPTIAPNPAPLPAPIPTSNLLPLPAPIPTPNLVQVPVSILIPIPTPQVVPTTVPTLRPAPTPKIASIPTPNLVPIPAPIPTPNLVPIPAPVPTPNLVNLPVPAPIPTSNIAPAPVPILVIPDPVPDRTPVPNLVSDLPDGGQSPGATPVDVEIPDERSPKEGLRAGAIAGIVVACVFGVLMIGALIWLYCSRNSRHYKSMAITVDVY